MTQEIRTKVVEIARTWLRTPYASNACVKGLKGGVDCAMILIAVYSEAGVIDWFDPRPYPTDWHFHQNEERYMNTVTKYAKEVPGPDQRAPKMGDLVLFKIARTFAHGGIVTTWPSIIHARSPMAACEEDLRRNGTGKHALWPIEKKFFSHWDD